MRVRLLHGDCRRRVRGLGEPCVVVSDPPYGLEYMQAAWDALGGVETSPTCDRCGGKLQGGNRCVCGGLAARQAQEMQEWHRVWLLECRRAGTETLRVFGGTRVCHRLAAAMEEAGLVVVGLAAWGYASGWPKGTDVGKAIDRRGGAKDREAFSRHLAERRIAAGMSRTEVSERVVGKRTGSCWNWEHFSLPEREFWPRLRDLLDLDPAWGELIMGTERDIVAERTMIQGGGNSLQLRMGERREVNAPITAPATVAANRWHGWNTALRPGWEPVVVGKDHANGMGSGMRTIAMTRKPMSEPSVAANVLKYGVGAINIDGSRVPAPGERVETHSRSPEASKKENRPIYGEYGPLVTAQTEGQKLGRWPANMVLVHRPGCRCLEIGRAHV